MAPTGTEDSPVAGAGVGVGVPPEEVPLEVVVYITAATFAEREIGQETIPEVPEMAIPRTNLASARVVVVVTASAVVPRVKAPVDWEYVTQAMFMVVAS
jgi:hypothetical protein